MKRWGKRLGVLVAVIAAWKIALAMFPPQPLRARFATSTAILDREGQLLRLTLAPDEQYRLWTPLDRIAPELVAATVRYEDRRFRWHPGVNPWALARAAFATYGSGERRVGGSTLTMQLARRLWRIPSHTPSGKLKQIAGALWLEFLYDKNAILEAYLNSAPYGGNLEGAGAASLVYFGKPPSKLTQGEALTLAVIPQNPSARAKSVEARQPARTQLAQSLGVAADEDLPLANETLPFAAPHFVDEVLQRGARGESVETPLDGVLQKILERRVKAYVAQKREVGIKNAAALLVDTRDLGVRALVGSADFFAGAIAGQVNGATAKRSPGSALKPFVYGLAIDQGIIHPESMLRDVPTAFAAYSPENFDGRFAGPISAREALVRSRNIPALEIAAKLARPTLHDLLRTAGVTQLRDESHYGLGIALGNAEVTMEELVALYAALARKGHHHPLRWRSSDALDQGHAILSDEAAFLVVDMLADNPRPGRALLDEKQPKVAWKTGTSWGFRDAWAVGLFGPYVLAVWVGNFSGEGNPAFVGVSAAAPLYFAIVDAVLAGDPRTPPLSLPVAAKLKRVPVCALTGGLPTSSCPHKKRAWFVPGRSPIEPCTVHRAITLDSAGRRACPPWPAATTTEVYEVWPSDLARLFAQAGLPRRALPPPAPGCDLDDGGGGRAPSITSPLRGVVYTLQPRKETKIALSAVTDGTAREVFWFLDDRYVGRARSGAPLFVAAEPGAFTVRAVDDLARSDSRDLRIEAAR